MKNFEFNKDFNGLKKIKLDNYTYQFEKKATGGEIIIWSVAGAIVVCALAPAYIPYVALSGGLITSLYGIASTIKNKSKINKK